MLVYFSALYMYLYISGSQENSNGRCYRQISVYIFCIITNAYHYPIAEANEIKTLIIEKA